MSRSYAVYDVFTDTPLFGNPLAVVFQAEGLSDDAMQAITREFNLSETVFVIAPQSPDHAARLRIFTPGYELPFAGHPTVGTAVAVAEQRQLQGANRLVLEETIGPILCQTETDKGRVGFARFDLPRQSQPLDFAASPDAVAKALGLSAGQIGFDDHQMKIWSAGVPFLFVPVKDQPAVEQVQFDAALWVQATHYVNDRAVSAFVYCRGGQSADAAFHARMFSPAMGIAEDPATGSAVAALTGAVHAADRYPDGRTSLLIEQGFEMGRPSQIHVELDVAEGQIIRSTIGGYAVRIASGHLEL
ncbi:MAG: hypothetical protein RIR97_624 [Pseudomonadota bacterium]